jgi:hypothetical protein
MTIAPSSIHACKNSEIARKTSLFTYSMKSQKHGRARVVSMREQEEHKSELLSLTVSVESHERAEAILRSSSFLAVQ